MLWEIVNQHVTLFSTFVNYTRVKKSEVHGLLTELLLEDLLGGHEVKTQPGFLSHAFCLGYPRW